MLDFFLILAFAGRDGGSIVVDGIFLPDHLSAGNQKRLWRNTAFIFARN
jgi:hypothetical protein